MTEKPTSITARRDKALQKVARERLHLDLTMDHSDSTRTLSLRELQHALEEAYEAGRRSARL